MNKSESFSRSVIGTIDEICDRFESAWQAGETPRIEDFLSSFQNSPKDDVDRTLIQRDLLLLQLLLVEWSHLADEECELDPKSYFKRFPEDADTIERALAAHKDLPSPTVSWSVASTRGADNGGATESMLQEMFGPYQVADILGRGAFGAVYLARDPRLDRFVALKIPRSVRAKDPEKVARFLDEARVVAQLRHANIVSVFEAGQLDSTYYIASDYIPGQTLRQVMNSEQALSIREVVDLVRSVAEAVHYAHTKRIIHRDIKPENILIDEDGMPLVADFGLARNEAIADGDPDSGILGTPSYMSPEQATGASHLADARSDLWSIGVLLYELLTGQRPFRGKTSDVLTAIPSKTPPAPHSIRSEIPADLESVCLKCLEKDVDDRYPSCQHLADELMAWLEHRPVTAHTGGPLYRLKRYARRQPVTVALSLLSLALAAVAVFMTVKTMAAEVRAAADKRNALEREQHLGELARAEMLSDWKEVKRLAILALERGYDDPARLKVMLVRSYGSLYEPKKARALLDEVSQRDDLGELQAQVDLLAAERALVDGDYPTFERLAVSAKNGKLGEAEQSYLNGLMEESGERAVEHFARATEFHPHHDRAWNYLCMTLAVLGRHEESRQACNRAHGLFPNDPTPVFVLGFLDACAGNLDAKDRRIEWMKNNASAEYAELAGRVYDLLPELKSFFLDPTKPTTAGQRLASTLRLLKAVRLLPVNDLRLAALPSLRKRVKELVAALPPIMFGKWEKMEGATKRMSEEFPEATFMVFYAGALHQRKKFEAAAEAFSKAAENPSIFPELKRFAAMISIAEHAHRPKGTVDWDEVLQRHKLLFLAELDSLNPNEHFFLGINAFLAKDYILARLVAEHGLTKELSNRAQLLDVAFKSCAALKDFNSAISYAEERLALPDASRAHEQARKVIEESKRKLKILAGEKPVKDQ